MFLNFNNFGFMNYGCGMNYPFGSGIASLFSGVRGLSVFDNCGYTGGYYNHYGNSSCCQTSGWPIVGYAVGLATTLVGGILTAAHLSRPKQASQTKEEELADVESKISAQEKVKKESTAKNDALAEERTEIISEKETLSAAIETLGDEIDNLEIELVGITDKTEKAKKEKEISKKKATLNEKKSELKTKETRQKAIEKEQKTLLEKIEKADSELEELQPKQESLSAKIEAEKNAKILDKGDGNILSRTYGKYKIDDDGLKLGTYETKNSAGEKVTKNYTISDMEDSDWRGLAFKYKKGSDSEKNAIRKFIRDNIDYINNNLKGSTKNALTIINNESV